MIKRRFWMVKRKFATALMKFSNWLYEDFVITNSIGSKIEIDVNKFCPPDGKWHQCGLTVEYFMKTGEPAISKECFYLDGIRVSSILREIKKEEKGDDCGIQVEPGSNLV